MNFKNLKNKIFGGKSQDVDIIGTPSTDSEVLGSLTTSQEREYFNPKEPSPSRLGKDDQKAGW